MLKLWRSTPQQLTAVPQLVLLCSFVLLCLELQCAASEPLVSGRLNSLRQAVLVTQDLTVGTATAATTINCAGQRHAFVVRQSSLALVNVRLVGCSHQAIVLEGPAAKLTASSCTFSSHGGSSTQAQGVVIAARQAAVQLSDVVITGNSGQLQQRLEGWAPSLHPACNGSGAPTASSRAGDAPACGSPMLLSSLVHLWESSMDLRHVSISNNTAGAVIAAEGSAAHGLRASHGSTLADNNATWLLVVDSLGHDRVGRRHLLGSRPMPRGPFSTYEFVGRVRSLGLAQLRDAARLSSPERFVGKVPRAQSPMQVHLEHASITGNSVQAGLAWLRLVNTSLVAVNITSNTAAATVAGLGWQRVSALAEGPLHALQQGGTKDVPAWDLCNTQVHFNAMFQVVAPAGFDMLRCSLVGNIHLAGGLLRVTDGMALTSLRNSTLNNNTVASVLRFEGRTWVRNTTMWRNTTEAQGDGAAAAAAAVTAAAVSFPRPQAGKQVVTELAYKKAMHERQRTLVTRERACQNAALYVTGCHFSHNVVFHGVMLVKGQLRSWQAYQRSFLSGLLPGASATPYVQGQPYTNDTSEEELQGQENDYAASLWLVNTTLSHNRLRLDPNLTLLHNTSGSQALLSTVLSQRRHVLAAWAVDRTTCQKLSSSNISRTSAPPVAIHPAVVSLSTASAMLEFNASHNKGFQVAVSLQASAATASMHLVHNDVQQNVARVYYSTLRLHNSSLSWNRVDNGSILDMRSVEGQAVQVQVVSNKRERVPGEPHPQLRVQMLQPIWRMRQCHLHGDPYGGLHDIVVSNNSGLGWGCAVDVIEFSLQGNMSNVVIRDNIASGLRLAMTDPHFAGEGITVLNATIVNNSATSNTGGLLIGMFVSRTGDNMEVAIIDSTISNNTIAQDPYNAAKGINLFGGGISLMYPGLDRMTAPRGQQLPMWTMVPTHIVGKIKRTRIQANVADSGGGVWSSLPTLQIEDCNITDNTAFLEGGGLVLQLMPTLSYGPEIEKDIPRVAQTRVRSSIIARNAASNGGAISCTECKLVVQASAITDNMARVDLVDNQCMARAVRVGEQRLPGCGLPYYFLPDLESFQLMVDGLEANKPIGVGGAIMATFSRKTGPTGYVAVCGSSHAHADLTGNSAWLGGLVYLFRGIGGGAVDCPKDCPPPGWDPCEAEGYVAPPDTYSPAAIPPDALCGVQLHHVDWSNTSAEGERLIRPSLGTGFRMLCGDGSTSNSTMGSCGCGDGFQAYPSQKQELPAAAPVWYHSETFAVFSSKCLAEAATLHPHSWERCMLNMSVNEYSQSGAKPAPHTNTLKVVAGDPVSLTFAEGQWMTNPASYIQARGPSYWSTSENQTLSLNLRLLRRVDISPRPGNGTLYMIGPTSAAMGPGGIAQVNDVVFQPKAPPTRTQGFTIQAVRRYDKTVYFSVELLRCALGRHMVVGRCIKCAESNTFTLEPNVSCQPCVPGAVCTHGLLRPDDGHWSHNPFVPQVLRCPLAGACTGNSQHSGGQPSALSRAIQPHHEPTTPWRRLLGVSNNTIGQSDTSLSRSEALLRYDRLLADALAEDPTDGPPLLLHVSYKHILEDWQGLQCAPGYKGLLCGSCDPAYLEPTPGGTTTSRRYALFLSQCIDCAATHYATRFVLVFLFLLFFAYVGLGIVCQVKAEGKALLRAQTMRRSGGIRNTNNLASRSSAPGPDSVTDTAAAVEVVVALEAGQGSIQPQMSSSLPGELGSQEPKRHTPHSAGQQPAGTALQNGDGLLGMVEVWKVLTSYVQVLAMVRFLPVMSGMSTGTALAFIDLSIFTQFAAFDCILPGPLDKLAYTRILLSAFGVPVLMLIGFSMSWVAVWGWQRMCAAIHQRHAPSSSSGVSTAPSNLQQVTMDSNGAPNNSARGDSKDADNNNSTIGMKAWGSPVASFVGSLPSRTVAKLAQAGADLPRVPLRRYLPLRLVITAGILAYSCYPLFTSNMMQLLSCQPIQPAEGVAQSYGRTHYAWLQERFTLTGNPADDPAWCHPGSTPGSSHQTCQVAGSYWRQDYGVQCFVGFHRQMAIFGAVMLCCVGVAAPFVLGLLLWLNKSKLNSPMFALKYSFFYSEYKEHVCFWEFVIMARKLAFLAIFLAFVPELVAAHEETVGMLQLQLAAVLTVILLVLHERLRPFKKDLMNRLERLSLVALNVSFLLLSCSMALAGSQRWRLALLSLTGALNAALLLYFAWHIGRRLYAVFGSRFASWLLRRSVTSRMRALSRSASTRVYVAGRKTATILRAIVDWLILWNKCTA